MPYGSAAAAAPPPLVAAAAQVGRVGVPGVGTGMHHEERHRAYLELLRKRNQARKRLGETDQEQADRERRERGFNTLFSGANARRRAPAPSHRRIGPSVGCSGVEGGGSGAWGKHWDERTVELMGMDGVIHAIRPTGERYSELPSASTSSPGIEKPAFDHAHLPPADELRADWDESEDDALPGDVDEALQATLDATQEELRDLCQRLREEGLVEALSEFKHASEGEEETVPASAPPSPAVASSPPRAAVLAAVAATTPEAAAEREEEGGAEEEEPTSPPCGAAEAPLSNTAARRVLPLESLGPLGSLPSGETRLDPFARTGELAMPPPGSPSPKADEIATRIARLPGEWRGALLQLLAEAEAEQATQGGGCLRS